MDAIYSHQYIVLRSVLGTDREAWSRNGLGNIFPRPLKAENCCVISEDMCRPSVALLQVVGTCAQLPTCCYFSAGGFIAATAASISRSISLSSTTSGGLSAAALSR